MPDEVVADGGEDKDQEKPSRRLPVEEQAGKQQPYVPQGALPVPVQGGIHSENDDEKQPEGTIKEGPRAGCVVLQELQTGHHGLNGGTSAAERTSVP